MTLLCWLIFLLEARHAFTFATRSSSSSFAGPHSFSSTTSTASTRWSSSSDTAPDDKELPPDLSRRPDVLRALQAVREACHVTKALQPVDRDALDEAVQKTDRSPVTVADFAVQARILHALQQHNTEAGAGFIAEEDSAALREDAALCAQVADAAGLTVDQVVAAIDLGKTYNKWNGNDNQRPKHVWCLDPIDGTRGFLRGRRPGGQYAIALALLEDGVPVVGVLGCPNLPVDDATTDLSWKNDDDNEKQRGCVFVAVQGGGCYQLPVVAPTFTDSSKSAPPPPRLHVTTQGSIESARFCIGVEKYSDAQGQVVGMARHLQGADAVTNDGEIVNARRMDSQAKHGVIARGGAEWYVRLPRPGYVEWIWDHAAGYVVVTEAGGTMTDTAGQPLDFSLGAQLSPSVKGVLMSCGGKWHKALVEAYVAVDADSH